MERSPAVLQLLGVVRATAAAAEERPGEEIALEAVEQTMAMLTPETIGMVPYAHAYITPAATLPGEIRYLHVAQEATFSVGVFVLPPGACIPLHDHPNMSVLSHVLYGSVKITSYDCVMEDTTAAAGGGGAGGGGAGGRGPARNRTGSWFRGGFGGGFRGTAAAAARPQQQHRMASLRASAWYSAPHTSRLTPSMANVHELEAGRDGTAILDVLIPPYDEASGRDCTYYRPVYPNAAAGGGGGGVRLVPCSPGDEFRVVRGEFISPHHS
eukprot:g11571.t1